MKAYKTLIFSMMAISGTLLTGCSDDAEMPANPDEPVAVREATNDIIYEVNPRFYGTSNCLANVTASLDDIAKTGATVLWVMPINEPGVLNAIGSPYCVKDYKAVNSKYGTLEDFRNLVTAAHNKGMKVILDWIANHTAWDNAWITSHPEWYTQDANGNIVAPSGWTDVAELNYDNADMRAAMTDAMAYWIDAADIDGYRFDHVDGVPADYWTDAVATLRAKKSGLIMLGETSDSKYNTVGFDMNYGWNFASNLTKLFNGKITASNFYSASTSDINALPSGMSAIRYSVNHDTAAENTLASLYGSEEAAEAAYVIALMLDGTPMIYSSQIIDYTGTVSFFDYSTKAVNADKVARLQALASAYKSTQALRCGQLETYQSGNAMMFSRAIGSHRVLTIVNISSKEVTVKTPISMAGQTVTNSLTSTTEQLPVAVTLPAYGYAIYSI
jgi:glycosidase